MKKYHPKERRRARELAVQALYQWQIAETPPTEIELQFRQDQDMAKVDTEYFSVLLQGVTQHIAPIDEKMQPALDRPLSQLNPVELAILRLAIYELLFQIQVPPKAVINEALELTKRFGATDGYKYVNAVLDRICKSL